MCCLRYYVDAYWNDHLNFNHHNLILVLDVRWQYVQNQVSGVVVQHNLVEQQVGRTYRYFHI